MANSTGYFGCRDKTGKFDPKSFERKAKKDQVKMIEIKLSQGAKPDGGMLLAPKVTQEIAETRGIEVNQDCISPAKHMNFLIQKNCSNLQISLKTLWW